MSALRLIPLVLLTLLAIPLQAQDPVPRISLHHGTGPMTVKLPWERLANSWCVEASSDLFHWDSLGELLEINGAGDFPDPQAHPLKKRYYRAIHKGRDLQAALNRNRARWDRSGISDYDFTFQWLCFCTPDYVARVDISVRNDRIQSITRLEDGVSLDASRFHQFSTIDGLFDLLQQALDGAPHSLSVRFDPRFGAPRKAWIDYRAEIADEERGFVVGEIRVSDNNAVQITDTPPDEIRLDPFSLNNVSVRGNSLIVNVSHSGGCEEHDFELFMSPGAFLESFPVQANLYIRHNAHGDLCRALITRDLIFDLGPIADLHGQPGPILLNLHDYSTENPVQVRWERSTVTITDTPPAELQLDPFWLQGATIRGDSLTLSVEASGGCRPHTYELFMSPGAFLKSLPPQANLYIRHNGHDDPCDAIVHSEPSFDLSPISDLYGRKGTIVLNIYEYFSDQPAKRIQVNYEQ